MTEDAGGAFFCTVACATLSGPEVPKAGTGLSKETGLSAIFTDFLCFLSLVFLGLSSPDLTTASCTAGDSTGPVGRAAGAIKGESEGTAFELEGFTAILGVEKTLPLLNKASTRANCSAHLSFIRENCSAVTKVAG